ncbi:prepilin-type cleavage/methylation domain-containing protein [Photobacterium kishitanii]|uniref:pilin n=1 Tax=Photobacterium kishitanii TaxID=318456 RepID=UPI000D1753C7|nr:pilin [Photobacterium kishitanii]PSW60495.1 prepilin-type cleavage/methylation domain-containing protein [Photobacterium kishitanii]
MNKQQGFTLIELMIVVAIIGVLSAIAVPAYQKYVAKAEGAAALSTLTGLKTNAEAFTVENGTFPKTANSTEVGTPSSALGTITYPSTATDGSGHILFSFTSTKVSPLNSSVKIALKRDASGTWSCASTATADSGITPKGCDEGQSL